MSNDETFKLLTSSIYFFQSIDLGNINSVFKGKK